jgi:signal transduction histidine kinase
VIRYGTADLGIEVTDTGRGPAAPGAMAALATHVAATGNGAGHGLRGMRERAAAAGGTIEIGRAPAGGFRVAALLPFDAPAGPDAVAADNEPEVLR